MSEIIEKIKVINNRRKTGEITAMEADRQKLEIMNSSVLFSGAARKTTIVEDTMGSCDS